MQKSYRFLFNAVVAFSIMTAANLTIAKADDGGYGAGNGSGKLALPEVGSMDGLDMFHKILYLYEHKSSQLNSQMLSPATYNSGITYYYVKDPSTTPPSLRLEVNAGFNFVVDAIQMDSLGSQILWARDDRSFPSDSESLNKLKTQLYNYPTVPKILPSGDWAFGVYVTRKLTDGNQNFITVVKPEYGKCAESDIVPVDGVCYVTYFYKKVPLDSKK